MNGKSKYFTETFAWHSPSETDETCMFVINNVRFSLLTPQLLRVECDKKGVFTDKPTQVVINRNFCKPQFKVIENGDVVIITTSKAIFIYDTKAKKMLSVALKNGKTVSDYKKGNLKGTYRTLDNVDGSVKIGDGIMSKNGVSVIDDSKSLILEEDGTISARPDTQKDEYYFAYNREYRECLKDFFMLCGEVPLVPRYCLGNWWSRYKAYTQKEYMDLMEKFIDREIPVTVATIDMDWHWTDVKSRFGSLVKDKQGDCFGGNGWTGYSWNTELFPDYKGFLKWLKDKNFKITVNLHPAQGVRFFEDMYDDFAKAMDVDTKSKKVIPFDITDPKFIDAYFNILHKPYEKDGVDFWWIDWQQGKNTKVKNLDPLWALNHYHTLANKKEEKRPLILSRFAEAGSHRYPLGFSGDTAITWDSLKFQPYFTSTATNIGYTWWSHDIGGHHHGSKDDELYIRWVQYGMYSPIMRLHSTSNEFMGKEPWKHNYQAEKIATDVLRQRHTFIPYLYSMNYRTHKDSLALCEPMYYQYPYKEEAYEVDNQFLFGSELMVAPITEKINPKTNLASVEVWLPEGRWTDIYTDAIYPGGQKIIMYRGIESIPVFAKEGAIIPLSANDRNNSSDNPKDMVIRIYRGNNTFDLYEDDGISNNYQTGVSAITSYTVKEENNSVYFTVSSAKGDTSVLPEKRNYKLIFEDISDVESLTVVRNGKKTNAEYIRKNGKVEVTLKNVTPKSKINLELCGITARENRDKKEQIIELITKYQLPTDYKRFRLQPFLKDIYGKFPVNTPELKGPVEEVLKMK